MRLGRGLDSLPHSGVFPSSPQTSLPSPAQVAHPAHHLLTGACSKQADVTESCIQLQNTEARSDDKEATSPGLRIEAQLVSLPGPGSHRLWSAFLDDCLESQGNAAPCKLVVGRERRDLSPQPPPHSCSMCVLPKGSRELSQLSTRQKAS